MEKRETVHLADLIQPTEEIYEAKYDHETTEPDYLPFSAGDKIKIIEKPWGHENPWWKGELDGKTGYVPVSLLDV